MYAMQPFFPPSTPDLRRNFFKMLFGKLDLTWIWTCTDLTADSSSLPLSSPTHLYCFPSLKLNNISPWSICSIFIALSPKSESEQILPHLSFCYRRNVLFFNTYSPLKKLNIFSGIMFNSLFASSCLFYCKSLAGQWNMASLSLDSSCPCFLPHLQPPQGELPSRKIHPLNSLK